MYIVRPRKGAHYGHHFLTKFLSLSFSLSLSPPARFVASCVSVRCLCAEASGDVRATDMLWCQQRHILYLF